MKAQLFQDETCFAKQKHAVVFFSPRYAFGFFCVRIFSLCIRFFSIKRACVESNTVDFVQKKSFFPYEELVFSQVITKKARLL